MGNVSLETLLLAKKQSGGGGSGGTSNYNQLTNLPSVNGVVLKGNKTLSDLGALASSDISITEITGGHNVDFGGGNDFDVMDGSSGVYVGSQTPTDPDVNVWIDPSGTATTIPTKTSDLTNDSGFLTLATLPIWDGGVSG